MAKQSVKPREFSALRIPGFNAEASLHTSRATYSSGGGSRVTLGAVQPANVCWCYTPWGLEPCPCKIRAHL